MKESGLKLIKFKVAIMWIVIPWEQNITFDSWDQLSMKCIPFKSFLQLGSFLSYHLTSTRENVTYFLSQPLQHLPKCHEIPIKPMIPHLWTLPQLHCCCSGTKPQQTYDIEYIGSWMLTKISRLACSHKVNPSEISQGCKYQMSYLHKSK